MEVSGGVVPKELPFTEIRPHGLTRRTTRPTSPAVFGGVLAATTESATAGSPLGAGGGVVAATATAFGAVVAGGSDAEGAEVAATTGWVGADAKAAGGGLTTGSRNSRRLMRAIASLRCLPFG